MLPIPLTRRLLASLRDNPPERRQVAVAGLTSIALRALLLVAKFAFIVVLAKFTDPATVGIYALLVTIISVAIYMIGLEIHTYTGREIVADTGDGQGGIHVQSHLTALTAVFVIALPIIWGFTYWIGLIGKFVFPLFALVLLLEIFGNELGRYLVMLSRPVAANVLQFVRGAAWMPAPITLLLIGYRAEAVNLILWSWLVGAAIACAFGFWRIRGFLRPLHRMRLSWLSGALKSARHYYAVALLAQVQYYSDRFVVQYFMGESAVGVLSFFQSFANTMVAFVQTGVLSIMLPRLLLAARNRDVEGETKVRHAMFKSALGLAGTISIVLAIGMPFLLNQMNKAAYAPTLPIFYVLLLGNLAVVVGMIVHMNLYARRQDAQLMRVSLFVIPVGLGSNIFTVPAFGIAGAAFTFITTASLDVLLKYRLLTQKAKTASEAQ